MGLRRDLAEPVAFAQHVLGSAGTSELLHLPVCDVFGV